MSRIARPVRLFALMLALGLQAATAFAQEPAPEAGEAKEEGPGPVPGYIASGFLGAASMFVLCKSARR